MNLRNRLGHIPVTLFLAEGSVLWAVVLAAVTSRPVLVPWLLAYPVVSCAFGSYDVRSQDYRRMVAGPVLAALVVTAAFFLFHATVGGRNIGFALGWAPGLLGVFLALSMLRGFFAHIMTSDVQPITLRLPPSFAPFSPAYVRCIELSGYPAFMDSEANVSRVTVAAAGPNRWGDDDTPAVGLEFDTLRFFDATARLLPPELLELLPDCSVLEEEPSALYPPLKRMLDVIGSLVLIAVTVPLWIFASLGILIADGRPVFFAQWRVGHNGRMFRILKFRTLRSTMFEGSPIDNWDDRLFAFGALLRRTRIDELPQLLQVLSGAMSLVGPRPEMRFYHDRSIGQIPYYAHRLRAKPGLTGWAQIRFPHATTEDEYRIKTAHDLWYIAHRNLLLDVRITIQTVGIVLRRFGAK